MKAYHCARGWFRRGLILLGSLALLAPGAICADEWYLKIDGVPGALTEGRFAGWTPVQSAGALVCLPANPTNDTSGTLFSCEVRKWFDRLSPALLQRCGENASSRRVTLACLMTQPRPALHQITLDNAFVSSVAQAARSSSETLEMETIHFRFDKIEFACLDLDANGGTTGGLTARFDRVLGAGDLRSRPPFQVTVVRENGRPGVRVTWPAERGHRYELRTGTANGGVWKTTDGRTAATDGTLSLFLPMDAPHLLMRVEEVD